MDMEDIFNQLKSKNQNTIENLIKWLKNAKIIELGEKETEKKLHELFSDVNPRNIGLEKFKHVIATFAEDQKRPVEEFNYQLGAHGPALLKMADEYARQDPRTSFDTNVRLSLEEFARAKSPEASCISQAGSYTLTELGQLSEISELTSQSKSSNPH